MDLDDEILPSDDDSQSWHLRLRFSGVKPKSRLGRRKRLTIGQISNKDDGKKNKEEDSSKATLWLQNQNNFFPGNQNQNTLSNCTSGDTTGSNGIDSQHVSEHSNFQLSKSTAPVTPYRNPNFSNPLRDIINLQNEYSKKSTAKNGVISMEYKMVESKQTYQDSNTLHEKDRGTSESNPVRDVVNAEDDRLGKDQALLPVNRVGHDSFSFKTPGKNFSSFLNLASPIDLLSGILSGNEDTDDFLTAVGNVRTPCVPSKFQLPNCQKDSNEKSLEVRVSDRKSLHPSERQVDLKFTPKNSLKRVDDISTKKGFGAECFDIVSKNYESVSRNENTPGHKVLSLQSLSSGLSLLNLKDLEKLNRKSDSGFFEKHNTDNLVDDQKMVNVETAPAAMYSSPDPLKFITGPSSDPNKYYETVKTVLNTVRTENTPVLHEQKSFKPIAGTNESVKSFSTVNVGRQEVIAKTSPALSNSRDERNQSAGDDLSQTSSLTVSDHSLSHSVSSHNQRISLSEDQKSTTTFGSSLTMLPKCPVNSGSEPQPKRQFSGSGGESHSVNSEPNLQPKENYHFVPGSSNNPKAAHETFKFLSSNRSVPSQFNSSAPPNHFSKPVSEDVRPSFGNQGGYVHVTVNSSNEAQAMQNVNRNHNVNHMERCGPQHREPKHESNHPQMLREMEHEFVKPWAIQKRTPSRDNVYVNGKPYNVLSLLGQGGSSEVYQVLEPKSVNLMAIKCVNLASVEEVIANGYLNEIALLSKLQGCSSVIRMFDHEYVEDSKMLYVVMEKGDTDFSKLMKEITKTKKISMLMVMYYWTEMLNCVKDIHDRGIIHSDLKPANFLLVSGRLKLIDFGIASSLQGDMTSVVKDVTTGTFNYMSPEAIKNSGENGRCHKITYRSDIWSLGCILYNMVFGRSPFSHIGNTWSKLQAIADPKVKVEVPKNGRSVPPELKMALMWCLRKDPKSRPSAQELLRLLDHSGPDDSPITKQYNTFKFKYYKEMFPNCPYIEED